MESIKTAMDIISAGGQLALAAQSLDSTFKSELSKLRSTLPKTWLLIDRVGFWRFKYREIHELLPQLKDATHDAQDLLVEFAYEELKEKVEGPQRTRAGQFLSSPVNFARSWISCRASKVKEVQERLDHVYTQLKEVSDMFGLPEVTNQEGKSIRPVTTAFIIGSEIFGRDKEKEEVIQLLGVPSSNRSQSSNSKRVKKGDVRILPIVGIGGVGKTTLAQMAYNAKNVQRHFKLKCWVCVSDCFDVTRLTKEILFVATKNVYSDVTNLNALQVILEEKVASKRFLIVLDDVWTENRNEWQQFFAPLKHASQGSMILVTTRSPKVARMMGNEEPIFLEGLPDDLYWEFFKSCAFGPDFKSENQIELHAIAKRIAGRLRGSPLAAKTLGHLLNSNMDVRHWRNIMNSKIWELEQEDHDILPALQLSYQYLPPHLKNCFSYCSLYPKDHVFMEHELIYSWIMAGFIANHGNSSMEDVARGYLVELISRAFFQKYSENPERYVIHDLLHDVAQFVTVDEFYRIENGEPEKKILSNIRYVSISDWDLNLNKLDLSNNKKLWFILVRRGYAFSNESVIKRWFEELLNIRVLCLHHSRITELPDSIGDLKYLQSLDISYTQIKNLPNSLGHLYNLQFLNILGCPLKILPEGSAKLISLCWLLLPDEKFIWGCHFPNIAKAVQRIKYFDVKKENGHRITALEYMTELRGDLYISCLENMESVEEANQAKINKKGRLKGLSLEWRANASTGIEYNCHYEEVFECLCPHPNLEYLMINKFPGARFPCWLQGESLSNLKELVISQCSNVRTISQFPTSLTKLKLIGLDQLEMLGFSLDENQGPAVERQNNQGIGSSSTASSLLRELEIQRCPKIASLKEWLLPQFLPFIRKIYIRSCKGLVSLLVERFAGFASLEELTIKGCPMLSCPRKMVLPPSLKEMELISCGHLDESIPNCLENLTSLTKLIIVNCPHVKSIPVEMSGHLKALKYITTVNCKELQSLGGPRFFASVQNLRMKDCPKLEESGGQDMNKGDMILYFI